MTGIYLLPEQFQAYEIFDIDYYDGPILGAIYFATFIKSYRFQMLDWDNNHDIRIFGLGSLSDKDFQRFIISFNQFNPTQYSEHTYLICKQILDAAKDYELLLALRTSDNKVLAVKEVTEQDRPDVQDWFTSQISSKDWFEYLGLTR